MTKLELIILSLIILQIILLLILVLLKNKRKKRIKSKVYQALANKKID